MNYNPIARNYDWMSRLIFRRAQVNAQKDLLKHIPAGSTVLIAGGGTGWILDEITKLHPQGLTIDYVESSDVMLELSKKRNTGSNTVHFIGQNIEDHHPDITYDAVLTAFLFDNFSQAKGEAVFTQINCLLKQGGIWLYADFVPQNPQMPLWQKVLFKIMYAFFRILCRVEAKGMMNTAALFKRNYTLKSTADYFGGFIYSACYLKG